MSWVHLIRHTKVYQEAFEEGRLQAKLEAIKQDKLETVPRLLKLGLSVEQIAKALKLEIDEVRQAAEKGVPE